MHRVVWTFRAVLWGQWLWVSGWCLWEKMTSFFLLFNLVLGSSLLYSSLWYGSRLNYYYFCLSLGQKRNGWLLTSLSFQCSKVARATGQSSWLVLLLLEEPWGHVGHAWVSQSCHCSCWGAPAACTAWATPCLTLCRECSQALKHSWRTCSGSVGCGRNVVCFETPAQIQPRSAKLQERLAKCSGTRVCSDGEGGNSQPLKLWLLSDVLK